MAYYGAFAQMQVYFSGKTLMAGRPQKQRSNKPFIARQLEKLLEGKNFAEFERENQLPVTTVRRIMNGIDPRISTLSMIAKACGVPLDYFAEGEPAPDTEAPEAEAPSYDDVMTACLSVQAAISEVLLHLNRKRDLTPFRADLKDLADTARSLQALLSEV